MFVRGKVIQALEGQADRFRGYQITYAGQMEDYGRALRDVATWSHARLTEQLAQAPSPGAQPTAEQDERNTPVLPFGPAWNHHQDARVWAMEVLSGRPTFAVDGSQIPPVRTISPPVAMVQIGWFENPHQREVQYEKDVEIEILPPDAMGAADSVAAGDVGELHVSLRRYIMEAGRIVRYMRARAGYSPAPVAFFDGSLVASFAARLPDDVRGQYIDATVAMIAASEETRVPLIGYVDTSYARDLVTMLGHALRLEPARRLADAPLLASLDMLWGDRSMAYICARDEAGILDSYQIGDGTHFGRRVAFAYLKTTTDSPPARVEFPLWLVEDGRLEETLDIVRAEAVIGNGYPYPLETADAVAVLTFEDRERFYRLFQQFAERHELRLRQSRKAASKRQRRV